ncbi:MAG: hypothetical protein AAB574_00440 [Patescibacteria group bacterium]
MAGNYYWLISITSESTRVSLVSFDSTSTDVKSLGPETAWNRDLPDSLIRAVDTSLSAASAEYQLPADSEPEDCAFIIPPLWVGDDGRIYPEILKSLEQLCKELKFHPLGFIGDDDAFVESYSSVDSFPGSYILLHLLSDRFQLTLVYLGSIKKRITRDFGNDFSVKLLEDTLMELNFSSALPPKIIIIGSFTNSLVEDIKNYNWVETKDTETFLHLPDIVTIPALDLQQLFSQTVFHQLSPLGSPKPPGEGGLNSSEVPPPESKPSSTELEPSPISLVPVDASDFGFGEEMPIPETESNFVEVTPPFPKHHFRYYWLLPLVLLFFVPVLPLYLAKTELILHFTPIEFKDSFILTLDSTAATTTNNLISVSQKNLSLSVSASIPTTGKKEIGEKARGEVVIFNKLDTIQNLNKGVIFSDPNGQKFELTGNLQVPGSTYNLDAGIITLGQAKTSLIAVNIGPESNLPAKTQLISSNPNHFVKVLSGLTGGTKEQVSIVSAEDRSRILEIARQNLQEKAKNQIQSESAPGLTIFDLTAFFNNPKTDFNREIGEATDSLALNLSAQVSFLYVDTATKSKILSLLLQNNPKLSGLDPNSLSLNLSFVPKDLTSTKSTGTLIISGQGNPQIDINSLRRQLAFKNDSEVKKIVSALPRFYNLTVKNSLGFINLFHRLPRNPDKITIVTKN